MPRGCAPGFSYVQLLLVVALLAILAGVSAPYYLAWQERQRVQTVSTMLWTDLHFAQSRAMQLEQAAPWGIYIDDVAKQYIIFHGNSYNPADGFNQTIHYPSSIVVELDCDVDCDPDEPVDHTIAFSGFTGTAIKATLTITSISLPTATNTITLNAEGLIEQ